MIGCLSHKVALDVKGMKATDGVLDETIEEVHDTMKQCRKLKNAAVLRNLTALAPTLPSDTRWSGDYETLKRFSEIRDDIIEASEHPDSNISVNGDG